MEIRLNGATLICHRCGGYKLEIVSVSDENKYIVWCNECGEQTCEDFIDVKQIKFMDIWK